MKLNQTKYPLLFLPLIFLFVQCKKRELTAAEILNKSISYHDPDNNWANVKTQLLFTETHLKDNVEKTRNTEVWIDNRNAYFKINRGGEEVHGMAKDSCFIEKGNYNCDRAKLLRNYYIYLWGLPMKLKDPGTEINNIVKDTLWENQPAYELQVAYEQDVWLFYFSKESFKLLGYAFTKKDGSGERILLSDEIKVAGMRLPQKRSWFTHEENKFLGTDFLKSGKAY